MAKAKKKKSLKKSKRNSLTRNISTKDLVQNEDITSFALERIRKLEELHNERKTQHTFMDTMAFWTFLFIALLTNFFLSFVLVFLIIFLRDPLIYAIVIIIGLSFGLVYSYLIHGMRHLFFYHHIYAKLFLLITGVINIIYIVVTSKIVLDYFGIKNYMYSHLWISMAYFLSYLLPYFLKLLWKHAFGRIEIEQ